MRIFLIVTFLMIVTMTPAYACRCSAPTDARNVQSMNDANIIIQGEIIEVSHSFGNIGPVVKVKISDILKGEKLNKEQIITIAYNMNTASCGHFFETGNVGTWGLYDTRAMPDGNMTLKAYGFRMMASCDQYQIQNYFKKESI